jgi:hypothetical protein
MPTQGIVLTSKTLALTLQTMPFVANQWPLALTIFATLITG